MISYILRLPTSYVKSDNMKITTIGLMENNEIIGDILILKKYYKIF